MSLVDAIVKSYGNEAVAPEAVSVRDYGAKGDGVTDDTQALQLALRSTAKLIIFPIGRYLITETLTVTDPSGLELIGMAGAGAEGGHAPVEIFTKNAIEMMVLGDPQDHKWQGPTIRNIGFYGIQALCGLKLLQLSSWTLENYYAANMNNGAGLVLDGGSTAMDYGTMINPRIVHCANAIRSDNHVTDITIIGGRITAERPSSNPGAGILINGQGRWSIFGTGVNNYLIGIDAPRLRYSYIRATIEANGPAELAQGSVGVRIIGGQSTEGDENNIQCGITGYETGIEIGSTATGNALISSMVVCTTDIVDNGIATSIGVMGKAGAGIQFGYLNTNAVQKSVSFGPFVESYNRTTPAMNTPPSDAFLVKSGSHDGGLYLGSEDANSAIVGAGIYASAAGPYASSVAGSYMRFHDGVINFHNFSGAMAGSSPGSIKDTISAKLSNGSLYLYEKAVPQVIGGAVALFLDEGKLNVRFDNGEIVTLAEKS